MIKEILKARTWAIIRGIKPTGIRLNSFEAAALKAEAIAIKLCPYDEMPSKIYGMKIYYG